MPAIGYDDGYESGVDGAAPCGFVSAAVDTMSNMERTPTISNEGEDALAARLCGIVGDASPIAAGWGGG